MYIPSCFFMYRIEKKNKYIYIKEQDLIQIVFFKIFKKSTVIFLTTLTGPDTTGQGWLTQTKLS